MSSVKESPPERLQMIAEFDEENPLWVGIDLGMTRFSMAVCSRTQPPALWPLGEQASPVPTALFFPTQGGIDWGEEAYRALLEQPERGAWLFKRKMGFGGGILEIEERVLDAEALTRLFCRCVWQALGKMTDRIEGVTVAVPAYFRDAARRATLDAVRAAGWPVRSLLNEPTAAAIAHHADSSVESGRLSFVFDLGGGTLDITILERQPEGLRILASVGDDQLGGQDWDDALIWPIAAEFLRLYGWNPLDQPEAFEPLRRACQQAREALSFHPKTILSFAFQGVLLTLDISRAFLETHCAPLLERCKALCVRACKEAALDPSAIQEVLLAGGGSQMPMIQASLGSLFPIPPQTRLDPASVVALGAAYHAQSMATVPVDARPKEEARFLPGRRIQDITPHPLGLLVMRDGVPFNRLLIPRHQPLPSEVIERDLTTLRDNQEEIDIFLLQSDQPHPDPDTLLSSFQIGPLPPHRAGQIRLEICFHYNTDGVIQLRASLLPDGSLLSVRLCEGAHRLAQLTKPVPRDILLAIDCSASMQGRPLLEAKLAIREFFDRLHTPEIRLGLLSFGDPQAHLRVPLMADTLLVKAYLAQLKAQGSTPLAEAIHTAHQALFLPRHDTISPERWLILLTDGVPDHPQKAREAARLAHNAGIHILTLGLGPQVDADFLATSVCSDPSMYRRVGQSIDLSSHFTSLATELSAGAGALTRYFTFAGSHPMPS